jgi:AcrR family transcriptional regulator
MEPTRRARKKSESRQRLVECAAALFGSRGYDATTMEDIGECADVSRATVFNYFPRKEDLVVAWFESRRAEFAVVLADGADRADGSSGRLGDAFRALARIFEGDPQAGRGMMRAWLHAGGPLLTPDSDTTRLFAEAVRVAQDRGGIVAHADPDRVGRLLFDAYSGVLYRWVSASDESISLEDELVATLDLIFSGIAAPAGRRG